MATKAQKEAIYKLIDQGEDGFLQLVQEAAAFYYAGETQEEMDAGILEAEEDIKAGRTYSIDEAEALAMKWFD